jgi:hypothetical protein
MQEKHISVQCVSTFMLRSLLWIQLYIYLVHAKSKKINKSEKMNKSFTTLCLLLVQHLLFVIQFALSVTRRE